MTYVDDALVNTALGSDFWVVDGVLSEVPPSRDADCSVTWEASDLAFLFDWVVSREAVVTFANLAKAGRDPWQLFDELRDEWYWDDNPARRHMLLKNLYRTFRPPYPFGYWYDGGVCGWLEPAATRELANLMPRPRRMPMSQRLYWAIHDRAVANGNGLLWGLSNGLLYFVDEMFADGETPPLLIEDG